MPEEQLGGLEFEIIAVQDWASFKPEVAKEADKNSCGQEEVIRFI